MIGSVERISVDSLRGKVYAKPKVYHHVHEAEEGLPKEQAEERKKKVDPNKGRMSRPVLFPEDDKESKDSTLSSKEGKAGKVSAKKPRRFTFAKLKALLFGPVAIVSPRIPAPKMNRAFTPVFHFVETSSDISDGRPLRFEYVLPPPPPPPSSSEEEGEENKDGTNSKGAEAGNNENAAKVKKKKSKKSKTDKKTADAEAKDSKDGSDGTKKADSGANTAEGKPKKKKKRPMPTTVPFKIKKVPGPDGKEIEVDVIEVEIDLARVITHKFFRRAERRKLYELSAIWEKVPGIAFDERLYAFRTQLVKNPRFSPNLPNIEQQLERILEVYDRMTKMREKEGPDGMRRKLKLGIWGSEPEWPTRDEVVRRYWEYLDAYYIAVGELDESVFPRLTKKVILRAPRAATKEDIVAAEYYASEEDALFETEDNDGADEDDVEYIEPEEGWAFWAEGLGLESNPHYPNLTHVGLQPQVVLAYYDK